MSNGKNPLVLMMALSMPGAASAIGLGDIHVDSGLNERLAAQIDLVGATALELSDLRAAVADRDTFLRYGVDRPAFLATATFKVTQDSRGRPVLAVRSTESFTEPVVNFLVDLRWTHGELVRQYTLLLDPPGFGANRSVNARALDAPASVANPAAAPPVSAAPAPAVPAAPAAAAPIAETKAETTAQRIDPPGVQPSATDKAARRKTTHIKVGAKATLRGVAWRAGERSETDLQKMMIAIFRANPSAFDGNINRLHRGAILTIPSRAQAATLSSAEAKREVHAQMAAWRAGERTAAPHEAMNAHPAVAAAAAGMSAASASPTSDHSTFSGEIMAHRVQSLEKELSDMKGLLQSEQDRLVGLERKATGTDKPAAAALPPAVRAPQSIAAPGTNAGPTAEAPPAQRKSGHPIPATLAGLGLLGAALGALYAKLRRRTPLPRHDVDLPAADAMMTDPSVAVAAVAAAPVADAETAEHAVDSRETAHPDLREGAPSQVLDDAEALMRAIAEAHTDDATHPMLPILAAGAMPAPAAVAAPVDLAAPAAMAAPAATAGRSEAAADPTVNMRVDTVNMRMESTRLDYNLLDLDLTAQHVQMPSVLNEHAVVKERRTNLADVLRLAIEREPDRHDLRMKLLELYYAAAATNRKAFLEVVQKFARDRDYLQAEQWDKIAFMGRQIAAENPLFAEASAADDDLADCA